jgi:pimeloyl-ACP methyl ester carboxylesterase
MEHDSRVIPKLHKNVAFETSSYFWMGKLEKIHKLVKMCDMRRTFPQFPLASHSDVVYKRSPFVKRGSSRVRGLRIFLVLLAAAWAGGCAKELTVSEQPIVLAPNVIFVADGAGDFRAASTSVRKVVARDCLPGSVQTVIWSHGYMRILKDQLDYAYARAQGYQLAETILALRQTHPEVGIYVVGHSAGAVVALAAAESLPPCTIDAMALLAPSLSTFYDVRPALLAVRRHMDVYYSTHDNLYLGLGTGIVGTSERLHAPASGRVGFQVYEDSCKLRQHQWQCSDWHTGNRGGHYGAYQPGFLREQVIPLMFN